MLWLHQSKTKGMHIMTNIFEEDWENYHLILEKQKFHLYIFLKISRFHTKRWNIDIILSISPDDTTLLSLPETSQDLGFQE